MVISSIFSQHPLEHVFKNNKSAFEHSEFVDSDLTDLISAGSIVECALPPTEVNLLPVALQSSGKKRLLLDLRYPNSFLTHSHPVILHISTLGEEKI